MIRMVAIDVDGTLLDSKHRLSPENRDELVRVHDQGVQVVLATGRMPELIEDLLEELGIGVHLVCANGALVRQHGREESLVDETIPMDIALEILDVVSKLDRYHYIYSTDGFVVGDALHRGHGHKTSPRNIVHPDLAAYVRETGKPPRKICSMGSDEELLALQASSLERWGKHVNAWLGGHGGLEYVPAGCSKKRGVSMLAEAFGFTLREVMAIGDADNDLEMVRDSGLGVAMGNASPPLKAVAKYVTATNDESGVAKAVRLFIPDRATEKPFVRQP
ncbi:MAG TPA: HAD family phosphatase [Firmicutes bacterium]|nr:HAD family phosphatase [Candidatus Fermentithermobacillaceae bacterium]